MSISYNQMSETWVSDEDKEFKVAMTPEAGDYHREFDTEEEFRFWYRS
jgi:hypothetical protein